MKNPIRVSGAAVSFLFLTLTCGGCGGGGSGSGDQPAGNAVADTPGIEKRTLFQNPTDSRLYSFSTTDGETFTYFGRRNGTGAATALTMLEYVDPEQRSFDIFFDDHGLPAEVVDATGTTIALEYGYPAPVQTAGRQAAASSAPTQIGSVGVTVSTLSADGPVEIRTRVTLDEPLLVDLDQAILDENLTEPSGNIEIRTTNCGEPINPQGGVMVHFRGVHSSFVQRYPATPTSETGTYVSWIPQRSPDPVPATLEAVCSAFADRLSDVCNVYNPAAVGVAGSQILSNPAFQASVCAEAAAAASLAATPVVGANVGAACGALFVGGALACETLGSTGSRLSDPRPDTPNIAQRLCGQLEDGLTSIDSALDLDKVVIRGVANFSTSTGSISTAGDNNGTSATDEMVVSAFGPFPTLAINSLEPSIDDFTTSPRAPVTGQPYSASVDLSCVLGADLSMSVVRDGTPLTVSTGFGLTQSTTFAVDVPDSPAGSIDTLRMSVVNNTTDRSAGNSYAVELTPTVSVAATDAVTDENGDTGLFTISRLTGDDSTPLTVLFALDGEAHTDIDYIIEATESVVIPAGADDLTIRVVPIADAEQENPETIVLTLVPAPAYAITPARATATIEIAGDIEVNEPTVWYYAGPTTYRETLTNRDDANDTVTCENTGTWSLRLTSGGGARVIISPLPSSAVANVSDGAHCTESRPYTDELWGGTHDGSTFSVPVAGYHLEGDSETMITGSFGTTSASGGYNYSTTVRVRNGFDDIYYTMEASLEMSLTMDPTRGY